MAYSNLYLPLNDSPLCSEVEKYKKLLEGSFLNRTRLHYKIQIQKSEKERTSLWGAEGECSEHNISIYGLVEAIHRVYSCGFQSYITGSQPVFMMGRNF